MSPFAEVHIGWDARVFLKDLFQKNMDHTAVNQRLLTICGIVDFFGTASDARDFVEYAAGASTLVQETDRAAYGDFQTNPDLAKRVVGFVKRRGVSPGLLLEPTFGKGNFILAALNALPSIQHVIGVEIYKPYVWAAKFGILQYFLEDENRKPPRIQLFHQDVFDFDFQQTSREVSGQNVLILGNPPWVTNAQLGAMSVDNLPQKSNFKNLSGLDAMTGKGNFDIGEYITLALLKAFQNSPGSLAFLVKNTVVKNLIFDQRNQPLHIGNLGQYVIDAKKEFGASVEASLLLCDLNHAPEDQCKRAYLEDMGKIEIRYGWSNGKFVSDLEKYQHARDIDGSCPFEWRQGLKHDCAAVMELVRVNGHFSSTTNAEVQLENDLVYGLLKSSELKGGCVATARKYTIVTQRRVGQDTSYIREMYPKTYRYLHAHWDQFANRKSSIYRGKPPFSIFGIGDYAFLPYKVAISGLYKSPAFTLVLPENGKPLMLDDTCYFLGFEQYSEATIVFALLNTSLVTDLLNAITFADAKRMFTKEVLQRIDLGIVAQSVTIQEIQAICRAAHLEKIPGEQHYDAFLKGLRAASLAPAQFALF